MSVPVRSRKPTASRLAVVVATIAAVVATTALTSAATPMTKAQARAIAKHINVTQADFPGYTAHPYQPSKEGNAIAKKAARCAGTAPSFAKNISASYDDGNGALFSSATSFVTTRAVAQRDAERSSTAHARHCSEKALEQGATQAGASSADVTLTPVSQAAIRGLDAIAALKITMTVAASGFHITLHGWVISFTRGNAEISLTEIGTADRPKSVLDTSLAKITARAKHQVPRRGLPVSQA